MDEHSPVEYSESEETVVENTALVNQLCKRYRFPAYSDTESNQSTATLTAFTDVSENESEYESENDDLVESENDDNYESVTNVIDESESQIEKSYSNTDRIERLQRKLDEIDKNTTGKNSTVHTEADEKAGEEDGDDYLSIQRKSWKKQMEILIATDLCLPKGAGTFFSVFRCFIFTNQVLALLNLFLEIIIVLGIYNVSFPWKAVVPNNSMNQWLSVIYFLEIAFPTFVAMYGVFAGAFDPKNLRTFSRLAVCHIFFFNALKLVVASIVYISAFDGSMRKEMTTQLEKFYDHVHLDLESTWDYTQSHLRCCGMSNYRDWYFNGTSRFPSSCCDTPKDRSACLGQAKKRRGCYITVQESLVQVVSASVVINWLQLIFLTASVLLAFRVWKIICSDHDYTGSEGWKEARLKHMKQSQLSFYFFCIPSSCGKFHCENFDTRIYPLTSEGDIIADNID